jgi:predicted nucleic acid-binding protein
MSERYFLDTNALLNAVFVDDSWARKIVALGASNHATFVTGERTLAEATIVLNRIVAKSTQPQLDLMSNVEQFLTKVGFDRTKGTLTPTIHKVTNNDQHIAEESTAAGACLVSSDAALLRACKLGQIPATSLIEAVQRFEGCGIHNTWYGVLPRYDVGSVYCRATPGPSNPQLDRKQTLFHSADWLWLYYDNLTESWCAEFPNIGKLSLSRPHNAGHEIAVSVSWKAGGNIILRVTGTDKTATKPLRSGRYQRIQPHLTVGSTIDQQHYWGNPIRVCIMDDRNMANDAWKNLKVLDESIYPDPYDRDRLEQRIHLLIGQFKPN